MAAIKLRIVVNELSNVLLAFNQIKVYRSTAGQGGPYTELTVPLTRINLVSPTTLYEYIDLVGDPSYWYRFAYWNSSTSSEGTASPPIQGEGMDGLYCTVQDLRDEGFTDPPYSDVRLTSVMRLASTYIEEYTGRWFEPRPLDVTLDGSGQPTMMLEFPVIAVSEVWLDDEALEVANDVMVYNRHVTQRLLCPDDRDNPKIELAQPRDDDVLLKAGLKVWTPGQKNVRIVGTFGYTDYDGTSNGKTPDLIRHACKLLCVRNLPPMSQSDEREDLKNAWRVTSHKTRDQSVSWGAPGKSSTGRASVGIFTGDPEIDTILLRYRRQPMMRSV
jgi:hypothetical protein